MSGWTEGLLGAVMGGTSSMVHSMDEEEKARRLREERSAAMQDAITLEDRKAEMRDKRKLALEDLERGRISKVQQEIDAAIPGGKPAWNGNKQGDAIDAGEVSEVPLPDREKFKAKAEEARKRGEMGLVKEYMGALEQTDKETDRAERRTDKDEDRAYRKQDLEERAKDRDAIRADRKAERADRAKDRATDKEPAKIREVKALAELAFGGDIEKATSFAYGTNAKPRAEAVMSMFAALKDTDADSGKASELMKKAEQMVDDLRGKDTASRGGVKVGGDKPAPKSEGFTFTGKYTKDGKRIMQDAAGNKFVE